MSLKGPRTRKLESLEGKNRWDSSPLASSESELRSVRDICMAQISGSPARDRDHWPGRGVMIMIPGNPGSGRRRPAEGPGRARAH
jgi:hypothetical protein